MNILAGAQNRNTNVNSTPSQQTYNTNPPSNPQVSFLQQLLSTNPQISALFQSFSVPNQQVMGNNTLPGNQMGMVSQSYNSTSNTNSSSVQRSKSSKSNAKRDNINNSRRREDRPVRKRTRSPPSKKRSITPPRREEPKKREKEEKRDLLVLGLNRDFIDLKRRYPELCVPGDFCRSISHWVDTTSYNNPFPLDKYVEFECDNESRAIVDHEEKKRDFTKIDYHIKVMPCTGIKNTHLNNSKHLARQLEFLVMRKKKEKTELLSIGGPLDPALDGEPSEESFIKCVVRHCKDLLELDLSCCKNWYKFLEVQYQRKDYKQITIIYLVSIWDALPSRDIFVAMWEKREQEKLEKNHQKKY